MTSRSPWPGSTTRIRCTGSGSSTAAARSSTRPTPSTSRASIRRSTKLAAGADILIYDAQYTPEEYPAKVGWGHSTWQAGAELARAAGVPQLVLFHHDPGRTDAQLAAIEAQARAQLPGTVAAREGDGPRCARRERAGRIPPRHDRPADETTGYAMLSARMSEHEQRFELLADLGAMIAGEVELDDLLATFADAGRARARRRPRDAVADRQRDRRDPLAGRHAAGAARAARAAGPRRRRSRRHDRRDREQPRRRQPIRGGPRTSRSASATGRPRC